MPYDEESDIITCPTGNQLINVGIRHSKKGFELLANAVVEQAVHDYKRLLHRVYVKGEHNPKVWYDLVELERFFCSKRFSQFTALDGRALIERIRGEMNL